MAGNEYKIRTETEGEFRSIYDIISNRGAQVNIAGFQVGGTDITAAPRIDTSDLNTSMDYLKGFNISQWMNPQSSQQKEFIMNGYQPIYAGNDRLKKYSITSSSAKTYYLTKTENTHKVTFQENGAASPIFTWDSSDFPGGVLPKMVLVIIQAGGGGGASSTSVTNSGGGGGGGYWAGLVKLDNYISFNMGASGSGGVDSQGGDAGDCFIRTYSQNLTLLGTAYARGGKGGYMNGNGGDAGVATPSPAETKQSQCLYAILAESGAKGGNHGGHPGSSCAPLRATYSPNPDDANACTITTVLYNGGGSSSSTQGGGGGASRCGNGGRGAVGSGQPYGDHIDGNAGNIGAGGGGASGYGKPPEETVYRNGHGGAGGSWKIAIYY